MKTEFKPLLVGRHDTLISEQNKSWSNLISVLNNLFSGWNSYFNEELQIDEFEALRQVPNLAFFIQSKHVKKNPEHANFIKSLSVKMEKMVEMVEIPQFDHLLSAVANVKANIYSGTNRQLGIDQIKAGNGYKRPGITNPILEQEFENWKTRLFNGVNFEFTTELETEIRERNSSYTGNFTENAALAYLSKFCEMMNVLNDLGFQVNIQDIPRFIKPCIETYSSDRRINEPKFNDPLFTRFVFHFRPAINMLFKENGYVNIFNNLDETNISEFIEKMK